MNEPIYVTVIARLSIPVNPSFDRAQAERAALSQARGSYPQLAWSVEHVETPWGL